jgi:hypothetical protein
VAVVGKVSMNFEFIEGRKAGDEMVKFGGVGVADKEIVYYKGEGGVVGVVRRGGSSGQGNRLLQG